ncbi:uncharacterized protein LOC127835129 [Dreissena polymorpha]|uniref:uncharacterized protein LOC127835129 n=1 Tax=Dreissena polymorpha TaxID=45954 RepID=UPI0022652168|nr:uncharacterized protein LOC127835129 [Dreissena polymorpha]XP_052217392.1 uncharacterized protein LOC127835129 [Dreissena polymorpha]XP_052217393.1 uncharacterized protein LOC127835129 [Dreissena polymorpha]
MLFKQFLRTENVDEAQYIIVQASSNGQTDCNSLELFNSLVQRQPIVSNRWVKQSLLAGTTLDMENFMVTKICQYGEICHKIDYQGFEFELRGDTWVDITKGQLLRLIKDIGGIPVINSTEDTVVVCADNMLHTSSQCLTKEWVFSCIVKGKMVSLKEQTTDGDIVYNSDELCVINEPLNKVIVAKSGSANGKDRSQKAQCCIYCES